MLSLCRTTARIRWSLMSTDTPSTAPLIRKLGIKPGQRIALVDAPASFLLGLGPLPVDVVVQREVAPDTEPDLAVIVAFVRDQASLAALLPCLVRRLALTGGLWLCWPK